MPSEHDFEVGTHIAWAVCGGEATAGEADERRLLALERERFLALAAPAKTRERIDHLRRMGSLLRN